jgi:PhnO protein
MTTREIIIRKAAPEDFEIIYSFLCELENTCFDKAAIRKLYRHNLALENNIYLVATLNNEVIGYLSCHGQYLLHHGGLVGEIREMFVRADKRSLGTGKLLIVGCRKLAESLGMLQLEVTSNNIRTAAHQFYMTQGFALTHKKFVLTLDS